MNQQGIVSDKEYFHSLTSLRGIAALWVSIGHLTWTVPSTVLVSLLPLIRQGYLAVDFFFILSGFVLAHAYKIDSIDTVKKFTNFCRARIFRIFPIHIVSLLILGVVYILLSSYSIVLPGVYGLKSFIAEFLLIHILPIFNEKYFFAWNYPSWTLVLEVWYFIFISGIIAVVGALRKKNILKEFDSVERRNHIFFILFVLITSLACIPILYGSPSFIDTPNFYNSVIRSGIEFLTGFFLYKAFSIKRVSFTKIQTWIISLFMLIGIFGWAFISRTYIITLWLVLIPFIITASLDVKNYLYKGLKLPVMLYLGNISYSLYIVHGVIERVFAVVYGRFEPTKFIVFCLYVLYICSILTAAHVIHVYVELPCIQYFKRRRIFSSVS